MRNLETENLAEYMYNTQRVLCIVVSDQREITDNYEYIMNTWGKRCNKIIFFSDETITLSSVNVAKDASILVFSHADPQTRLRNIMKFIYASEKHNFDWLMKVGDSTFIVMENLRHLLYQYSSDWPLLIGQRYLAADYMVGSYVLSKSAFIRLIENGFSNPTRCSQTGSNTDMEISKCAEHLNIIKIDGIDDDGKGMFFQEKPELSLFPTRLNPTFDQYYWHKLKQGIDYCCSDRVIAIHHFRDKYLYYLEYYIYKVKTFGRHRNREELPRKKTLEEIVQKYKSK